MSADNKKTAVKDFSEIKKKSYLGKYARQEGKRVAKGSLNSWPFLIMAAPLAVVDGGLTLCLMGLIANAGAFGGVLSGEKKETRINMAGQRISGQVWALDMYESLEKELIAYYKKERKDQKKLVRILGQAKEIELYLDVVDENGRHVSMPVYYAQKPPVKGRAQDWAHIMDSSGKPAAADVRKAHNLKVLNF